MRRWLALGLLALAGAVEAQPLTGGLLGRGASYSSFVTPSGCTAGSVAVFLGSPVVPACASDWAYTAGTPEVPEVLGPEILANGDFAEGPDGWAVGSGWTWAATAGAETGCMNYASSTPGLVTQSGIPITQLVAGRTYRMTMVIANRVGGLLKGMQQSGETYGNIMSITANGTHTVDFVAVESDGLSYSFHIGKALTGTGSVCSISVKEVISAVPATATRVDLDGAFVADSYSLSALNGAPASATATCTAGEIRWTATHVYLCSATDTWVRAALATWP